MDWNKYLSSERLRKSNRPKDSRNEFESDYGRVLFSPALRRMHDKTQVFPLTTDDNIHSRLTHSLEVMSIGHSLAIRVLENKSFVKLTGRDRFDLEREIPMILQSSCLVHDIGNPPFGHFGETVIQEYFKNFFKDKDFGLTPVQMEDFKFFDGNAQGFRVLTKLQVLEDPFGLNLTHATLASYLKYPNSGKIDKNHLSKKKRGVFQSEEKYLKEIAISCGLELSGDIIRHPLAFLMEAADSICYLVMDIEDGYNLNLFKYDFIKEKLIAISGMKEQFKYLDKMFKEPNSKMVNLRIYLIKRLVDLATKNFIKNIAVIAKGGYEFELIKDDKQNLAEILGTFCVEEIFSNKEVRSLELTGHSVLTGLLDYYIRFLFDEGKDYKKRALALISNSTKKIAFLETGVVKFDELDNYFKLRMIVDFISGMTDQYALNHYQKLSGQKII